MSITKRIQSITAAAGMLLACASGTSWGESASRTGNAADFLFGSVCPPPANAPCYDPQADGQKLFGTLTVIYDKGASPNCTTPYVKNMYVSLTLEQGGLRAPFTTDYLNGPPSHSEGFCMLTNTLEQVKVILALINDRAIPFFFACDPATVGSCPSFKIKAVTNYQYTTGHPSLPSNPNSGGFSADITLAVK